MRKTKGFTLIEVIVTLLIVGILASVAGLGMLSAARGYTFAKSNSALSEKAQLAMSRMNRTFIEVLDITTVDASPARVTYNRLSGGVNTQETLYLDTGDNSIKIAAGGSASGGDSLIGDVNGLTLTFKKGTTAWVAGTDDFSLLSTVVVSLVLNRPDGGTVTFGTVVSPRNNGNRGGSTSTTVPNPSHCFVATAAFGNADHPVVKALREFRDRFLLTCSAGRLFVRQYYKFGPYLADLIRDRRWACLLTQAMLLPLALTAVVAVHVPAPVLILALLICLTAALARATGGRRKFLFRQSGQNGALLLGLIATIVILGVLGAAMLSMTTSSTYSQISGNFSSRAYYLAEAGMRYAGSEFRGVSSEDAKDAKLEYLHNRNYSLSSDGTFHLEVYPYYFKTTVDPSGSTTLQTKFPGGAPAGMTIPASGYLKLGVETAPRQYTNVAVSGSNVTFTMSSAVSSTAVNTNVLPVGQGQASAQNISLGGNLTLSTGAGFFPAINGTFTIGTAASTQGTSTAVYSYKNRSGNVLQGIRLSQSPTTSFTVNVPASAYITSQKFLDLRSSGTFASGTSLAATRTISYSIPIGWVTVTGSTEKSKFTDTFPDSGSLANWMTAEGSFEVASGALHAKTSDSVSISGGLFLRTSLTTLNWGSTGVDLNQSWANAGYLLSYDAQTKVKNTSSYYMAGLVFRLDTSGQMYGVSFHNPNTGTNLLIVDKDGVPDSLCPPGMNQTPMILLWQEYISSYVFGSPVYSAKWLAYKTLTTASGIVNSSGKLVPDWSTLLVRIIEADSLQFNLGGPGTTGPLMYGDIITGAVSGATATVNGTPILTGGNWSTHDAAGWLTVCNATKSGSTLQFRSSGEDLLVNGVVRAHYTGTNRTKDNYIRVYYGKTGSSGTASSVATDDNRLANPVITSPSTQSLNWPVDNISDWSNAKDWFTLVQWTGVNTNSEVGGDILLLGNAGSEQNAIIRTNYLITPDSGTFSRTEVGLDTWGSSASSTFFDDFGLEAPAPGQTQGFLPGVQQ